MSLLFPLILVLLIILAWYGFRLNRRHQLPHTQWSDLGLWSRIVWVVALVLLGGGIVLSAAAIGFGWALLTTEDPASGKLEDIVAGPVYLSVTLLLVLSFVLALRRPTAAGLLLGITAILAPVLGNVIVFMVQPAVGAEGGYPTGPLIVAVTYYSAPAFFVAVLLLTVALPRELRMAAAAEQERRTSISAPDPDLIIEQVQQPQSPDQGPATRTP